jgi:endonuclease/exonuclease/phosphatase family metal-dependent hydrolase
LGLVIYFFSSGVRRMAGLNLPRRRAFAFPKIFNTAAQAFSGSNLLPRPDILALQEADKETGRAGGLHVAAELARQLAVPYLHLAVGIPRGVPPKRREWWLNFEEQISLHDSGDTGVAFLTCADLQDVSRIDLPWHECAWRPRLAAAVTTKLGPQRLRLLNVHVDPHGPLDNQHSQLGVVLEHAERHDGPVVILGDFNTLSKAKAVEIRRLMESRGYSTPFPTGTPTWRGAGLRFHADWIFVRDVAVTRWGVARPLSVSDHWPIWAEISLLT